MKVSVITPNYNGVEFLDKYFKSLDQDNEYIGEVIIIDNGSNDSSLDYIEKNSFSFPIVVIKNNENLGFAPAVNQGILKSKYDYIFSLNNDTELKKGSIKSMLDLIQEDDVFSVQAKMLQARNKQLIDDAHWGELDYFLIDLPPGTSDIHLTLISALQLTGVIVVTTPQPVALVDARKGVEMFQNEKINVPILGLVENMAWFTPAELPQNRYYIFGKDGGKALAEELQIPLLAQIPLVQSIREGGDSGEPIALQTGHPAASAFDEIATKII